MDLVESVAELVLLKTLCLSWSLLAAIGRGRCLGRGSVLGCDVGLFISGGVVGKVQPSILKLLEDSDVRRY